MRTVIAYFIDEENAEYSIGLKDGDGQMLCLCCGSTLELEDYNLLEEKEMEFLNEVEFATFVFWARNQIDGITWSEKEELDAQIKELWEKIKAMAEGKEEREW